jgi:hypothetical protein
LQKCSAKVRSEYFEFQALLTSNFVLLVLQIQTSTISWQSHLQGPPRHIAGTATTCGVSQFTGHLWTYESLAGGNKRRLFAMDAYRWTGH